MIASFYLALLALPVLLLWLAKFLYSRKKIYALSWQLPGPFALPLLGNALTYLCKDEDILDRTVEFVSKYPTPSRFWFGPKFSIILKEADQVAKVMTSTNFITKDEIYRFLEVVDGQGLITASGAKWKRDRKLMGTLFLRKNIEQYLQSIEKHAKLFVNILETREKDGRAFNVERLMHRCVADFINETILGTKTSAQTGGMDNFLQQIDTMYELIHARIVKVWLQVEWIFKRTRYSSIQEKAVNDVLSFLANNLRVVEENRERGSLSNSVMDHILDIRDANPAWSTHEELIHHLATLYTASEDTITTIASFALLLLGQHQEIQQRIISELEEQIHEDDSSSLTLETLSRLPYLDMCIKDVLRLFPIAPFIMRVAAADFTLDKITIPRGCTVVLSIFNVQRDAKHWERPDEFHPEHFVKDAVEKRHPYAFVPFSAGPRGCLGKAYANMALKLILVTVLRKYRVFASGTIKDVRVKADISVRTRDRQYNIKIQRRKP